MKKILNKLTVSLLVMTMVLTMTVSLYATNTKQIKNSVLTVKYNEADSTYDKASRTFTLYFDIPTDAANYDSVKIDLSGGMVDGISSSISMPGESFSFNINIRNQSGVDFTYKKGSYYLTDPTLTGTDNIYGIKSFSGKTINEKLIPYRISSAKAIYNGLFDKTSSGGVTGLQMATIDTYLEDKGYTGDEALTQYLLDYYNKVDKTNAKVISELSTSSLKSIFSTGINKSTYSLSDSDYQKLTDKQRSNMVKVDTKYRFRETEKQLSEYYYNYFYDWCVGVVMGKHVTSEAANGALEKRLVSTSSVVKVYNNVDGIRDSQDAYLANILSEENMKTGKTATILAGYVLDGPLTGNNAQYYEFGFENGIELEKSVSFGDVTVNKTLDLNGFKNNDTPTFIFKLTDSKGVEHYKTMSFKEGQTNQSIKFENIPLGKYVVEEVDTIRYEQEGEIPKTGTLTGTNISQTVLITNKKEKNNDFSDSQVVINSFKKTENGIEISQDYQGTQE
ncbi:MAG: hypothetical protein RR512_01760 [Coprobacillus sp.]